MAVAMLLLVRAVPATLTPQTAANQPVRATIGHSRRSTMPFDNSSLPIRLFTASHERSWNPADIDFSRERSDWLSFSDDERNLLIRLVSGFRVGRAAA